MQEGAREVLRKIIREAKHGADLTGDASGQVAVRLKISVVPTAGASIKTKPRSMLYTVYLPAPSARS